MSKNPSPKTDAMRVAREARFNARKALEKDRAAFAASIGANVIDDRVNDKTAQDPNGRGGKAKIKVPKRDAKEHTKRSETAALAPEGANEGRCTGCGKIRALNKEGNIISHSWPPPTRRLCDGAGKPPQ